VRETSFSRRRPYVLAAGAGDAFSVFEKMNRGEKKEAKGNTKRICARVCVGFELGKVREKCFSGGCLLVLKIQRENINFKIMILPFLHENVGISYHYIIIILI